MLTTGLIGAVLHADAAGLDLAVHLPGQTAIRRGDTIGALVRPDFAHVFRARDGRAVPRRAIGEATSA